MCFGGGVSRIETPESEYENRPVTVSGSQTGVDEPIDTAKATESLKIQRQKKEGTYVDPNLTTTKLLGSRKSGKRNLTKQQQQGRDAARNRAKDAAKARMRSKYKSSPTGRRTGVA